MKVIVESEYGFVRSVRIELSNEATKKIIKLGKPQITVYFNVYSYDMWKTRNYTIRFDTYHKILLINNNIYVLTPIKAIKGHPTGTPHAIVLYSAQYIGYIKEFKTTHIFKRDWRLDDIAYVMPIIVTQDGTEVQGSDEIYERRYVAVFETVNEKVLNNHALTYVSL